MSPCISIIKSLKFLRAENKLRIMKPLNNLVKAINSGENPRFPRMLQKKPKVPQIDPAISIKI